MKKINTLLISLIILPAISMAQGFSSWNDLQQYHESEHYIPKRSQQQPKAFGDTIYYEDFGSGTSTSLPLGWTTVDNNALGFDWIWSDQAPGGQYSSNIPALNSTSSSNGFLSLPSDLYNTPTPGTGPVLMDTWVRSPSFSIPPNTPSVVVKFEHFQRYCCSPSNELVMEVSTNGTNWSTPYDGTDGRGPNTITPNGETLEYIVSADLAFQTTGYIRFRSVGNDSYFWMIDDLLVYEGPENAMELQDWEIRFHAAYTYSPVYRQLPISNMTAAVFTGATRNIGSNTATNARLELEVFQDSTIGGGPGTGMVHSANTIIDNGTILTLEEDITTIAGQFFSFNPGWYRNKIFISSDSINQTPALGEDAYTFALTHDSVIALDRGPGFYQGDIGPGTFTIGGQDNDAIGNLMILDSAAVALNGSVLAKSVSVFISSNTRNDQVQISPRVWDFNEDSLTTTLGSGILGVVANSPFSTTITSADYDSWVTLPFFPPVLLTSGQYYYGVEQTGGALTNNSAIFIRRDRGQEERMGVLSTIVYFNDPTTPRWGNTGRLAAIRFNGGFVVGLDEEAQTEKTVDFAVFPNPNNGEFTLQITSSMATNYQMKVRSMTGQTVLSQTLSVNGLTRQHLDLSSFEKGIYFVSLENGEERLVKKVVVR